MKRKDLKLNQGGLYRCCIATIAEWVNEQPAAEVTERETFTCRYETQATKPAEMIVIDGVIRWRDPDYPPL